MENEPKILKIGGREIPLYYSTYETIAIQRDIGCTAFQLNEEVFGIFREDEDDPESGLRFEVLKDMEKTRKLGTLIRILGNAGLEEEGKEADLTDKWILRHIKPAMIMAYVVTIIQIIADGNKIEVPKSESDKGPVDEGLEEQNAKKQQGN